MSFQDFLCRIGLHKKVTIGVSTPKEGLPATVSSYDGKVRITTDKGTLSGWHCTHCHKLKAILTHTLEYR